jgi:hypothetical protein
MTKPSHAAAPTPPTPAVVSTTCPACGHHVAVRFYDGGRRPLATLAWPTSAQAARTMQRYPLDFVRCVDCGHVFNASFDYAAVPYSDKPNLMFNRGGLWREFIAAAQAAIVERIGTGEATVVEIGHGDGSFLRALGSRLPQARLIGFDPHGALAVPGDTVEFQRALFEPMVHMETLKPALIISRHVLEHFSDPLGFIQSLSFAAAWHAEAPLFYFEVPCVDRAIASLRTADFYYEHNSNFTTESFSRMLERAQVATDLIAHGYDGEVIYAVGRLAERAAHVQRAAAAVSFDQAVRATALQIQGQLVPLAARRTAIWGGTGKAAAFINAHGLDAERFPTVVDSDPEKVGTYVPGTGQVIRGRNWLVAHPAEVIIIPAHWRARDIVAEMAAAGIAAELVLIEHGGRLIDYFRDPHPYREAARAPRRIASAS